MSDKSADKSARILVRVRSDSDKRAEHTAADCQLFLWQAERRHALILATILPKMSMSVSVPWNSSLIRLTTIVCYQLLCSRSHLQQLCYSVCLYLVSVRTITFELTNQEDLISVFVGLFVYVCLLKYMYLSNHMTNRHVYMLSVAVARSFLTTKQCTCGLVDDIIFSHNGGIY